MPVKLKALLGEYTRKFRLLDDVSRVKRDLDEVLYRGVASVEDNVHVDTGSLKKSVFADSDVKGDGNKWVGWIELGGYSPGPHNPVTYAEEERTRGGGHDFFRTLPFIFSEIDDAIDSHFKRGGL